ncbi:hypothetical protein D5I55_08240 [Chakrabartia godavariana]|nr:hypothetical protein D5I55_08240 [Chakrabartia godavariana]
MAAISPIYSHARQRDAFELARDGWRQRGILAVSPSDRRLSFSEREFIRELGGHVTGRSAVAARWFCRQHRQHRSQRPYRRADPGEVDRGLRRCCR